MPKKKATRPPPFPDKSQILEFLDTTRQPAGKREIARAFHIRGDGRVRLKKLLKEMTDEGLIARDRGKWFRRADRLPAVMVVRVTGADAEGDPLAEPERWSGEAAPPRIYIVQPRRSRALGEGERALVRLEAERDEDGLYYTGRVIRTLPGAPETVLGLYEGGEKGGRIIPTDRRVKREFLVEAGDHGGAAHGNLVLAEVDRGRRRRGMMRARVVESLADLADQSSISLIAIHHHDIPHRFDAETLAEAEAARPAAAEGRADLRETGLITIDPADARDHDDAVYAEPDRARGNNGGWHIVVAIADVAHYVRPGTALDREALGRGNSCYFPDRVVPMLPERLSADLCSLKPGADRPALAAHLWIDSGGNLIRYRFERALIRSDAALSYSEVQGAIDGDPDRRAGPIVKSHLEPLYSAYAVLSAARRKRQPLELEIPEKKIILDDRGRVVSVDPQPRYDSHRLIEEFMVLANVAAARCLEERGMPAIYRVHEEPADDKLESLRIFLSSIGLKLARGQVMRPALFNRLFEKAGDEYRELLMQVVLRTQSQAYYGIEAIGHFGLALPRYAHFTSPIRRYADLVVHRALITGLGLGPGGLEGKTADDLKEVAEHISKTERRAMAAERESADRYLAAWLADHVGEIFEGRISGVARFGMFVTLEPAGGDGIVPASSLADDYYVYDEDHHWLRGRRTGKTYRLADRVAVRLKEAEPLTGSLRLELIEHQATEPPRPARGGPGKRSGDPRKKGRGDRRKGKGNGARGRRRKG